MIIDEAYIKDLIIPRNSSSHKGENGTIGVVGGSKLYHGAPLLSALGALRSGSDLTYLFVPQVIVNPIRAAAPDIIVYPLPDSKFTMGVSNKILNFRKEINTFVIGPGIVNQKMNGLINLVSKLQNKDVNIILDAGAINSELINNISGKNITITAHLVEFTRLIEKKIDDEESIKNEIDRLSNKADIFVLLSHNGFDIDQSIAQEIDGLDVIVGSHSQSSIESPEEVNGTLIVQAGKAGYYIGVVDVSMKDGKVVEKTGKIDTMKFEMPDDPRIMKLIEEYEQTTGRMNRNKQKMMKAKN